MPAGVWDAMLAIFAQIAWAVPRLVV